MATNNGIVTGDDGIRRCWWCQGDPGYVAYHDQEWGMPVDNDQRIFEKICLEGFQAGLSWLTILRKRPAFREVFAEFDVAEVAQFGKRDVNRLVKDARIVRHRGKIESTVNNAKRALELVNSHGSLAAFFWQFSPKRRARLRKLSDIVSKTAESTEMSKTLKKMGWSFVGPTTCYAFMQAMGIVNDHLTDCHRWKIIDNARKQFDRPT